MASMASFFALKATQAVEVVDGGKMRDESMQKITAVMENDANVETRTLLQTISSVFFATSARVQNLWQKLGSSFNRLGDPVRESNQLKPQISNPDTSTTNCQSVGRGCLRRRTGRLFETKNGAGRASSLTAIPPTTPTTRLLTHTVPREPTNFS